MFKSSSFINVSKMSPFVKRDVTGHGDTDFKCHIFHLNKLEIHTITILKVYYRTTVMGDVSHSK